MKTYKKLLLKALVLGLVITSCTDDFDEKNSSPNSPEKVPTTTLMVNSQFRLCQDIRDEWFSGRMVLPWVQYWAQLNYTEEDRYQYRENSNNDTWKAVYTDLMDLQRIVELNTDEATKGDMLAYGSNENQIAAARILKTWVFNLLTDTYGPIPYHSVGTTDPDFQALDATGGIINPVYAPMDKVYKDMIKELKEAAAQIDVTKPVFTEGDPLLGGDALAWKKFANSLRLRLAMHMRAKDKAFADQNIAEAIAGGLMTSNDDNAAVEFESTATNASPMYQAFIVSARTDFGVAMPFIDLLKGIKGPFPGKVDPRLFKYAAPRGTKVGDVATGNFTDGTPDQYEGQPYGVENHVASGALKPIYPSLPFGPIQATFGEVFMEYAEVCFLMSEYNNWDQTWYENGIRASMERWGVPAASIDTYIAGLPAASQETVLTQKYIALYMQPHEAWTEYRRTGYPKTLIKPNTTYTSQAGVVYSFVPLVVDAKDLPDRIGFSQSEQLLNVDGYASAKAALGGADNMLTKLWLFK